MARTRRIANIELPNIIRSLEDAVRAKSSRGGVAEATRFVAENIRRPLDTITGDEVPNTEALNQLLWARQNETEWRRSYDTKRIPAKGFASDSEIGFVDDGKPVAEVLERLKKGLASVPGSELRVVGGE